MNDETKKRVASELAEKHFSTHGSIIACYSELYGICILITTGRYYFFYSIDSGKASQGGYDMETVIKSHMCEDTAAISMTFFENRHEFANWMSRVEIKQ